MKLVFGKLMFEPGDTLHVEDVAGNLTLTARAGHICGQCTFCDICDARKQGNLFARWCAETHFVEGR